VIYLCDVPRRRMLFAGSAARLRSQVADRRITDGSGHTVSPGAHDAIGVALAAILAGDGPTLSITQRIIITNTATAVPPGCWTEPAT
jgi:hypothetical protein